MSVPEVLTSGNHEAIRLWRRKAALVATRERRPDLLDSACLSDEDLGILRDIEIEEAED
jgi:tRNA (guanine37-N1)-methyltransferase